MTEQYSAWRKSRHSQPNGGCIEAGRSCDGTIGVRDTKLNENSPILLFTRSEWRDFLKNVRIDRW